MKDYVQGGTLTEVTDLILLSLYEPRHGYAIIQFVEEVTNGRVLLGARDIIWCSILVRRKRMD